VQYNVPGRLGPGLTFGPCPLRLLDLRRCHPADTWPLSQGQRNPETGFLLGPGSNPPPSRCEPLGQAFGLRLSNLFRKVLPSPYFCVINCLISDRRGFRARNLSLMAYREDGLL
jgi:hypothetical protein